MTLDPRREQEIREMNTAQLLKSEVNDSGWRDNTYRRTDGSEFRVGLPRVARVCKNGSYEMFYNELAEAQMVVHMCAGR